MRKIALAVLLLSVSGCFQVDKNDLMKDRTVEKPGKPIEVNFEKLEAQRAALVDMFNIEYKAPDYAFKKDPFGSVVDEYRLLQEELLATTNPVFVYPFNEFKLVGILSGDVGNIAVLSAGTESFYLRSGEMFSENRSSILFIGKDFIKVRDNRKDIFGNTITEMKEIKLDDFKDTSKEKTS